MSTALRELELDGLILREQFKEMPPHVEYSLTELSKSLQPVFDAISNWGKAHGSSGL